MMIVEYSVRNYFEIWILSLDLIDVVVVVVVVVVQFQMDLSLFEVHQVLQRIVPLMDRYAK
jgi:hypothetical protein